MKRSYRKLQSRRLVAIALTSIALLTNPAAAYSADEDIGVKEEDLYVGSYFQIPGTSEWAHFDAGVADHPFEYTFSLKCFDDEAGNVDCLYRDRQACTAGIGGRLVYWFIRLKGSDGAWLPLNPDPSCIYSEKPRDIGDQIREQILSEFQSRPVQPGQLGTQPSPYTLIGAHTNFYVEAIEQNFDFDMFQQDIRIVARPTEFEWNYGDGSTYGPVPHGGTPLPQDRWGEETATSHVYLETGDYQVSVTVYFSAEYSVNGGPFVPIDGRATVPSTPQTISVWKSESQSVADDCIENPAGLGC